MWDYNNRRTQSGPLKKTFNGFAILNIRCRTVCTPNNMHINRFLRGGDN